MKVKSIYVNLPVKDLNRTRDFWAKLGFSFNEQFSNETSLCLIINDELMYAMFITHEFFGTFTNRPIADSSTTQILTALQVVSREQVDGIVRAALENGATRYQESKDHGWMYYDSFADPDGHQWEILFADISQIPQEMNRNKITIQTTIAADKRKVWNYYTQAEHITKWNFADPSWHCPAASNDMKIGGKYFARMEAKDGSFGFDFEAVYLEIEELSKFTYEFGGRQATVEFEYADGQTQVIVSFDPETSNSIELQRNGWQAILNNFKEYVEAN